MEIFSVCKDCHFSTPEDEDYCPKCGSPMSAISVCEEDFIDHREYSYDEDLDS